MVLLLVLVRARSRMIVAVLLMLVVVVMMVVVVVVLMLVVRWAVLMMVAALSASRRVTLTATIAPTTPTSIGNERGRLGSPHKGWGVRVVRTFRGVRRTDCRRRGEGTNVWVVRVVMVMVVVVVVMLVVMVVGIVGIQRQGRVGGVFVAGGVCVVVVRDTQAGRVGTRVGVGGGGRGVGGVCGATNQTGRGVGLGWVCRGAVGGVRGGGFR